MVGHEALDLTNGRFRRSLAVGLPGGQRGLHKSLVCVSLAGRCKGPSHGSPLPMSVVWRLETEGESWSGSLGQAPPGSHTEPMGVGVHVPIHGVSRKRPPVASIGVKS